MKIAWFTPFCNKSAIGKVSKKICECLSTKAAVTIFTPNEDDIIDTYLEVKHISHDMRENGAYGYDYYVYNLGNYRNYHEAIVDVSTITPGIVLLHDRTMLDYWIDYCYTHYGEEAFEKFCELLYRYEGVCDKEECLEAFRGKRREEYPLIRPFLEKALGVFSHARGFSNDLRKFFDAKIGYAYLPCDELEEVDGDTQIKKIIDDAHNDGKLVCVSNGMVSETKQIDKIQKILIDHPELRERFLYLVIGTYEGIYGEELNKIASEELADCMIMLGYQSYSNMVYALKASDFCFNLRYPNSEVCSLSLLEQMRSGKASVVLDSGIFNEVPEDTVIRLHRRNLEKELFEFMSNIKADELELIGGRASEFVQKVCTEESYVEVFMSFVREIPFYKEKSDIENMLIGKVANLISRKNYGDSIKGIEGISDSISEIFW